jgi:leucine-rich repeat transmembrane neuronal protein 1/2
MTTSILYSSFFLFSCIEKSKRTRDRISSETAENTALIIGIVAAALIAVILVVLLVLKLKNRGNTAYKIDERKNFSKTPSHSNSNAALLNTGSVAGSGGPHGGVGGLAGAGMAGGQMKAGQLNLNPALVNLEKKSPPSKKCGKDIKEWYV